MEYLQICSDVTLGGEEDAETHLFGFTPFTNCSAPQQDPWGGNFFRPERACQPASYAEASQRPIYTVLNQRKVDVGNPMFGVRTPCPLLGWILCLCSCAQDHEECLRVCV